MEVDFDVRKDNTEFTATMDNITYTWRASESGTGPVVRKSPSNISSLCEAATFRQAEMIVRNDALNEALVREILSKT